MKDPSKEATYTLYGDSRSGNCYKAAWILALTNRPFQWVETDVMKRETRTPGFLAMNPIGRVPLLQLPGGEYLAESNAMLLHLSEGTPFLPADALARAIVFQWLFFEQYNHEPSIAVARFVVKFLGRERQEVARLEELRNRGAEALSVMDQILSRQPFMAGERFTIADVALYAYTHVAHEGGFDLDSWPAVGAWLDRAAATPGYRPMADVCR